MKRKLRDELVQICTKVIESRDLAEIPSLYKSARALYEKLAVLKFIEEKLNDIEIDVSKNVLASRFEKMANAVMDENKLVPESNPHEEDIITPGIETIKGMIAEMPEFEVDQLFAEFVAKPELVKNDKDWVSPESGKRNGSSPEPSAMRTIPKKEISVGLNDRHAFVKHLFSGSTEDFNRVISQLNTIENEERSISFIQNMVKPDYGNWAGKEEYENRFMALIARRFS